MVCVWTNREKWCNIKKYDDETKEVERMNMRERLKEKQRIVIKIGSSSLTHANTGKLDLTKLEILVRELSYLHNQGKDVILVSSGAIAVGRAAVGIDHKPDKLSQKQACAAIGQARLMMIYQKLFSEYGQTAAQVLMTKYTMTNDVSRENAKNTFQSLLEMGAIPIVNENDTVSTDEIEFGDNDTLSALVAALVEADLLVLLSDIDGLFTDDPHVNPEAEFIDVVEHLDEDLMEMGKDSTGSSVGTGGMATKLSAARIAGGAGADMVIANGGDFHVIHKIMQGRNHGTLFLGSKKDQAALQQMFEHL